MESAKTLQDLLIYFQKDSETYSQRDIFHLNNLITVLQTSALNINHERQSDLLNICLKFKTILEKIEKTDVVALEYFSTKDNLVKNLLGISTL